MTMFEENANKNYNDETVVELVEKLKRLVDDLEKAKGAMLHKGMIMVDKNDIIGRLNAVKNLLPEAVKSAQVIVEQENEYRSEQQAAADAIRIEADTYKQMAENENARAKADADAHVAAAEAKTKEIQEENIRILEEGKAAAEEEKQRIIAEGQRDADNIIRAASEKAKQLASEQNVVKEAQNQASSIIQNARNEAYQMNKSATDYVTGMLRQMEKYAGDMMTGVRKTIDDLNAPKR